MEMTLAVQRAVRLGDRQVDWSVHSKVDCLVAKLGYSTAKSLAVSSD
jgi:hypothetical protein